MDQVAEGRPAAGVVGWFRSARGFLQNVQAELRKVSWPTRPELTKASRMVIILSIALGIAIGLLDWLLQLILVSGIASLAR